MPLMQQYRSKLRTAEQAVKSVKSGDWVDYGFVLSSPVVLDAALAKRVDELVQVKVRGAMRLTPLRIVEADPERKHFCYNSWHLSGYERTLSAKHLCDYIPMIYRNMPLYYEKTLDVDVAFMSVAPMDDKGFFSFSFTNSASKAILEKAKIIILEVNTNLPIISGGVEDKIHISEIDFVVESDNPPLPTIPPTPFTEREQRIATYIVNSLSDGAVIQLGIGALPAAAGFMIAQSDLKDIGMHTEMLVDAYMHMGKAGKITNRLNKINTNKSVYSFCCGSTELYEWAANTPNMITYPVNYTNSPEVMAQHDKMFTINNCISVDLFGQVTSEASGHRQISGTGGQLDFVTGGYQSRYGKSFVCFTSTYTDKAGKVHSRVVPSLPLSTAITNPRSQVHCLVSEWGCVDLAAKSIREKTEAIISIAHPDYRDELTKQAEELGIWRNF